jgi:hypothetical protein
MHDFDVGALSLSVPPASAVIQSYRPAVLVRNNGVHDALASGSLRIYGPAGLLIFTTEIYSATLAPGETGPAQAITYWTPPGLGRYMFIAYVTCINDQFEPNNNLAPCFVDVIPGEPTPPTPVAVHAAQHEEGGGDELNIDGLPGLSATAQTPRPHVASHQSGGTDQLNVGGLAGELTQDQPTKIHSNTKHDPPMATASALSSHQAAVTVHSAATNLAKLDSNGLIPSAELSPTGESHIQAPDVRFLDDTQGWRVPLATAAPHAASHTLTGGDPLDLSSLFLTAKGAALTVHGNDPPSDIALLNVTTQFLHNNQSVCLTAHALLTTTPLEAGAWGTYLQVGGVYKAMIDVLLGSNHTYQVEITGTVHACSPTQFSATLAMTTIRDDGVTTPYIAAITTPFNIPTVDTWLKLICDLNNAQPTTHFDRSSYYARTEAPAIP